MAHFNFVISQNAKWGHAGFYIDRHRMTSSKYAYWKVLFYKKALRIYNQKTLLKTRLLACRCGWFTMCTTSSGKRTSATKQRYADLPKEYQTKSLQLSDCALPATAGDTRNP